MPFQCNDWLWPVMEPVLLGHTSDRKSEDWGASTQQLWHDNDTIGLADVVRIVYISYNVIPLEGRGLISPPCYALDGALSAISKRVKDNIRLNKYSTNPFFGRCVYFMCGTYGALSAISKRVKDNITLNKCSTNPFFGRCVYSTLCVELI
jgi:hypothetical protein